MPVTYSFYALEAVVSQQMAGPGQQAFNPAVFHVGNLILHCLSASFVLIIARLITGNGVAALLAALFFALHPLQAESVAWISETKGMLSNCCCLAGLALQVYRARAEHLSKAAAWGLYAAMNVAFLLALLAKPSAIAVIPIAWIIAVGFLQRSALVATLALAPCAAVAAIISIVAKQAQGNALLSFIPPSGMRPLIAGDALAFYLYKLVCPFALTIDYARPPEAVAPTTWIWFAWLVPVGLAGTLALLPHRRIWLWALAIFVVSLLPVSGLISFLFQMYSTVSDRYVYLALLGPSLAAAWFFTLYASPKWIGGFVVLLAGLALLSAPQTAGFLTESNLGRLYAETGKPREAIEHLTRAAELKPDSFGVHHKLGSVLLGAGRADEAISQFQEVLKLKPDFADGYNDLGVAFGKANRPQEAIEAFREAIRLKPEDLDYRAHLMIAYAQASLRAEAIATAKEAIELAQSQGQTQMAANLDAWLRNFRGDAPR
jgi:tetratricopeptide (TPR) repeat protein